MMARIMFGSYMVRYPLGGMMSHVLQYLVGFKRLGHDVFFVEKAGYANSCFDPLRNLMSDDCAYGTEAVSSLLERFGLGGRWCYVDADGTYHGLSREDIDRAFQSADLFVDMGTHGSWLDEAQTCDIRVLIDGEPGYNQMRMETGDLDPGRGYDYYYTNGRNVGTNASPATTAGRQWRHIDHPVVAELFDGRPPNRSSAAVTTVMNWQSHEPIEHRGVTYGQKDVEFEHFLDLPRRVEPPMEIAVSGPAVPERRLERAGWRVRNGSEVTLTYDSFAEYVASSLAEFSVAKQVFVALNTGWFSDRSAVYLASGRPVVMQETGFSSHLPVGKGLFAFRSIEEAEGAVEEVSGDYRRQGRWARELARDRLDARLVLSAFLDDLGTGPRQLGGRSEGGG